MTDDDIEIDEDGNIILGELDPIVRKIGEFTVIDVTNMKDGEDMLFVENPKTGKMEIVPAELRCQMCDDDWYKHEITIDGVLVKVCDDCKKEVEKE